MQRARVVLEGENNITIGQYVIIVALIALALLMGLALGNLDAQKNIREEAIKLRIASWEVGKDGARVFVWKVCK